MTSMGLSFGAMIASAVRDGGIRADPFQRVQQLDKRTVIRVDAGIADLEQGLHVRFLAHAHGPPVPGRNNARGTGFSASQPVRSCCKGLGRWNQ